MSDKNDKNGAERGPAGLSLGPGPSRPATLTTLLVILLAVYLVTSFLRTSGQTSNVDTLATSDFVTAVKEGRVDSATFKVSDNSLTGTYWKDAGEKDDDSKLVNFKSVYVGSDSLAELMAQYPDTTYKIDTTSNELLETVLVSVVPTVLLVGVFVFYMRRMSSQQDKTMGFAKTKALTAEEERPKVKFADVAGIDEAVEELQEVRDFLSDPERYHKMGARIPRGVLLVGPP